MQKNVFKFLFLGLLMVLLLTPILSLVADEGQPSDEIPQDLSGSRAITNDFADRVGYSTKDVQEPEFIVGKILNIVLSFLGVVFLVFMVYGGFMWLTASGNEEKITKAKGLIKHAVIGLVIVFAAYMVSYFVLAVVLSAVIGK